MLAAGWAMLAAGWAMLAAGRGEPEPLALESR